MLQVNDSDENENRHVDAEQQHVRRQAMAGIDIAKGDRRRQLYQHISQRHGCATMRAASPSQQITRRRHPGQRPTVGVAVPAAGQPQPRLGWQGIRQHVQHAAHQQPCYGI
jgi:hypothetical protein